MQSTSFFNRPTFKATTIAPDPIKAEAYMKFSANLLRLKQLDRAAYDTMITRMDKRHEPWQSVDVDVCIRLSEITNA